VLLACVSLGTRGNPAAPDFPANRRVSSARLPSIERDARDFVANPEGKITLVEFLDYQCGVCKSTEPELEKLKTEHPDLRVVYKEYPIHGPVADRAAEAALLSKTVGRYWEVHEALMAAKPVSDESITRILAANSVSDQVARDPKLQAAVRKQIKDIRRLADRIKLPGTPMFEVDGVLITGFNKSAIEAAIAGAEKK
jgi:protein-disulfide isomerase